MIEFKNALKNGDLKNLKIKLEQGIDINDRHIELIARQMLRKVRVVDPGDTDFLIGDRVDRIHFMTVNSLMQAERKRVAVAKPVLMGLDSLF